MNNLLIAIISGLFSFAVTPLVKKFAKKVKAIDIPKDNRRVHKKPIPLLGGLSIYLAFILGVILKQGAMTTAEIAIVIGASIIVIGGVLDDIYDLKPWQKLLFQLVASLVVIFLGVSIQVLTNPFSSISPFVQINILSIPFTILWIIGVTNAFNLIDGLDGLAAGIALISSITIFIIAILNNRGDAATLTAILCGSIAGFLPYNFNPASIFMGDTGAQLLGFLLASISIKGTIKSATAFSLAVPIIALGVPIYDTLFAMIRRKINGKPIMQADRGHLHHRLLDKGFSQKKSVLIMYAISAILGAISIIAMQISTVRSYFLLTIVILFIVFLGWKFGFFKKEEVNDK